MLDLLYTSINVRFHIFPYPCSRWTVSAYLEVSLLRMRSSRKHDEDYGKL